MKASGCMDLRRFPDLRRPPQSVMYKTVRRHSQQDMLGLHLSRLLRRGRQGSHRCCRRWRRRNAAGAVGFQVGHEALLLGEHGLEGDQLRLQFLDGDL